MNRFACFSVLVALAFVARTQTYQWTRTYGAANNDRGTSVATDQAGNSYSTGFSSGTVFVRKLDPAGSMVWVKTFGAMDGTDICVIDGSIYLTGVFFGTVDFDPGPGVNNQSGTIYIEKLDLSGNFIWAKTFSTGTYISANLHVDAQQNIYMAGSFQGTVDFNPGPGTNNATSSGMLDAFIEKLDSSGSLLWTRTFGHSADDDGCNAITTDAAGAVLVTGTFRNMVDFDPGAGTDFHTSNAGQDVYIEKLDASGIFQWARTFGGTTWEDWVYAIAADAAGNVYIGGNFGDTVDFDPGPGVDNHTATGGAFAEAYIEKLSSSGNYIWTRNYGGYNAENVFSITIDSNSDLLIAGIFDGPCDFDLGPGTNILTPAGWIDAYVGKMDTAGNFLWAKAFGGTDDDWASAAAQDAMGGIYLTGYFKGTVDFDPDAGTDSLTSNGNEDIFVWKYKFCTASSSTITPSACFSYTSPSGNYVWSTSGAYSDTLTNFSGCDSLLTINLTIDTVDVSVTQTGITLTANASGAIYQWLDCNAAFASLSGETSQTFSASVNGNYAVLVIQNGCQDTSSCYTINTVGLNSIHLWEDLRIYPNPGHGVFLLNVHKDGPPVTIEILDQLGQKVFEAAISLQVNKIDLQSLQPGSYVAKITANGQIFTRKLIVQ